MDTIQLLKQLINVNTINSLNSDALFKVIFNYLDFHKAKYTYEIFEFNNIKSLILYSGSEGNAFLLNGHYDVVPVEFDQWSTDPFKAVEKDGYIYGRGATDMKGGLASLISAFTTFSKSSNKRVILTIVGDEEKGGKNGAGPICDYLLKKEKIQRVFVAEPTSQFKFGDVSKKGSRGVIWLNLILEGRSGHASRPDEANNPIVCGSQLVSYLENYLWTDKSDMNKTTIVCTHFNSESNATNIIPSKAYLKFDIRYNYGINLDTIKKVIFEFAKSKKCSVELKVENEGLFFLNNDVSFEKNLAKIVKKHTGNQLIFNTVGGSSDARFFSWKNIPVLEFGPKMENMHGHNERVSKEEIITLNEIILDLILIYSE